MLYNVIQTAAETNKMLVHDHHTHDQHLCLIPAQTISLLNYIYQTNICQHHILDASNAPDIMQRHVETPVGRRVEHGRREKQLE